MKLILPYFRKNLGKIILGMICMVVVDGSQLIIPQIVKSTVDTLSFAELDRAVLVRQCLFIVGLGLVMALLRYAWRMLLMGSARDLEKGIRNQLFRHVMDLDLAFYDRFKTGDIMAHATSDINHVRMAFGFGIIVMVDTVIMGGAILGILLWTNPKLTALAMLPMPVLIWFNQRLGHKMHDFHTTAQEAFSVLTEMVRESFFGIRVIKVFNFENQAENRLADAAADYFKKNLKRAIVMALLRPLLTLFFNLSTLIVVVWGGYMVMEKTLTPGELVAFIQYLGLLAWPIIAIGWMTNLFQRGMASLRRINTLMAAEPQVRQPESPAPEQPLTGRITFSGVDFSYDDESAVLSGIDLEIPAGSFTGISGPPGSGKTSLLQLIPRLYNPTAGELTLDGRSIQKLDLTGLRRQIALMPQEPFLFSGTIRENILMGRETDDKTLDRITHACELTRTLERMPDGLETVVGERGVTLSGGQKQRVALARTLIEPKPVILLDDPVSQLDTQTAHRVITRIRDMHPGATYLIVSHRLSALAACDRILIMNNGRIDASGTHNRLIETNPFYRDSYKVQQFEEGI